MSVYINKKRKSRRGKRKGKKNKKITYNIHDFNNIDTNTNDNNQFSDKNKNKNKNKTKKTKQNRTKKCIQEMNLITNLNMDMNETIIPIKNNKNKDNYIKDITDEDKKHNNDNNNGNIIELNYNDNSFGNMKDELDNNDRNECNNNNNNNNNMEFNDDSKGFDHNDDIGFDDDFDDDFGDDNDGWDDVKLEFGQQIASAAFNDDVDDPQRILQRALEKKRLAFSDKSKFWICGKCEFLNHPSQGVCMSCHMPQLDIIHHVLTCRDKLKTCPKCKSLIIPTQYEDHVDTCHPLPGIDAANWYCDLTLCEKNAINHVTAYAMSKSCNKDIEQQLLTKIKGINSGYNNATLKKLQMWLEWEVPMIIRIHVAKLIPLLLKDTHYRNLFEIGTGSGCTNQNTRKGHETKMFGDVYNNAKPTERPKYGCLNVCLKDEGDQLATSYGDGYFILNNSTVRWRTTLTIRDSFEVNGNCGTLKHCLHLLNELNTDELQELIEAAIMNKKGGKNQRYYREIQIHGPVLLNRDIVSLHCPKNSMNSKDMYDNFCTKNGCKLVWF